MVSPCISICQQNNNGFCTGCFRTPKEIRNWYKMSESEQKALLGILRKRKGLPSRKGSKK